MMVGRAKNVTVAMLLAAVVMTGPVACGAAAEPTKAAATQAKADVTPVVAGNTAFALDLYAKLREQDGNLFLSPYSISTALAMTYAGARGQTAEQMAKTLHFILDEDRLHPAFAALQAQTDAGGKGKGYQLSVANALWGQEGYKFLQPFLDVNEKHYGAGLRKVGFQKDPEAARQTINTWVEKQTQDRIKELLKKGIIKPLTTLVLTNAIYFKGDWSSQFKEEATRDAPFTLADGNKVTVPLMHQTETFPWFATETFRAIELPYVGKDLSMIAFLPSKADGLPALEKSFTAENLAKWMPRLRPQKIMVWLPKFKMTSAFGLKDTLAAMGMPDAFAPGAADFSGMDGSRQLYISAVVHKAFVEVNEEGTEAAGATAVVVARESMPAPLPRFRADHPFLFLIRDNRTGSILFIGRVANPKA